MRHPHIIGPKVVFKIGITWGSENGSLGAGINFLLMYIASKGHTVARLAWCSSGRWPPVGWFMDHAARLCRQKLVVEADPTSNQHNDMDYT